MEWERAMKQAICEAEISLREGNNGFGAVIVRGGETLSASHDTEESENDPTSHAELNAIKAASKKYGRDLASCTIVSTHEPCPMCAFAIAWSGIREVVYGYSIGDAITQGRRRINFSCQEAFQKAGMDVRVHTGILHSECAVLYRKDVREELKRLRNADDKALGILNEVSAGRRLQWFEESRSGFTFCCDDPLEAGYRLLLERFQIAPAEAPVIKRSEKELVFHSMNFCPTLEACRILGLDTRHICRLINEKSTDLLVKQISPHLQFTRNYDKLRPYSDYCEEMLTVI